ncbi:MAG TPA: DNA repair protein RecO [Herpetosiphonaceae bacterium]
MRSRERLYRTEALILRRSDFGEADRLMTLFTPRYGKRRVIAKGVRKTTSRRSGHVELFNRVELQLATGRNLDIVTDAQIVDAYKRLHEDLPRLSYAYYVAELVDKLTVDEEENAPVYTLLVNTFAALDTSTVLDLVARHFELHLLNLVGYRPYLFNCAICQEQLTEEADRWSAAGGGMLCPRCATREPHALPITLPAFKALRFLQREPIAATEDLQRLSEPLRREIEQLLRATLRPILERELKSVEFLDAVRLAL